MKICLDPGHSGPAEPGAVNGLYTEASLALRIAFYAGSYLTNLGHDVIYTRTEPIESDLLAPRVDLANSESADLFVSIHINAATNSKARGFEVYHYPESNQGGLLAKAVCRNMARLGCLPDRGVKEARFYVLKETSMPSILVECGFISNKDDLSLLASSHWQSLIGKAIADGVQDYSKP